MRTIVGVGLIIVCLGLASCSAFNKKKQPKADSSRPFTGTPAAAAPRAEVAAADTTAAPSKVDGILAGQVLDEFGRPPTNATIRWIDLHETRQVSAAPIYQQINDRDNGYFVIQGLNPGHHYRLVASVTEGSRVLSGTVFVTPPNPRVNIHVSARNTTADTPAPPPPPSLPGKRGAEDKSDDAKIDPPKPKEGKSATSGGGLPPAGPAALSGAPDLTRIADGSRAAVKDGFEWRPVTPSPSVSIPSRPAPSVPLPPPTSPEAELPQPGVAPPAPALAPAPLSAITSPIPSCVLVGKRLNNFALYDLDRRPWEYRTHRARLTLLEFWSTNCGPCRAAIPHLKKLQAEYDPNVLQVVSIAYGPVGVIQAIYRSQGMNYTVLLGGSARCPVMSQFGVFKYPTLILLDEKGAIITQWEGFNPTYVDGIIRQILYPPNAPPPPPLRTR